MRSVAVTGAANQPLSAPRTGGTRGGTARSRDQAPASSPGPSRASGRGFNAFKGRTKDAKKFDSNFFKVEYDKTYVIAFLEAENFDFVDRHELENVPDGDGGVWKYVPRNCIRDDENGVTCPVCGVGDEPKPLALFNVVDLADPGHVLIWEASKGIFDTIVELAEELAQVPEDKGGPLDLASSGVYAAVSKKKKETKSGRGGFTEYTVRRVKERDLDEDYGLTAPTDAQFEVMLDQLKTSDDIKFNTVEELEELVAKLED